MLHLFPSVAHVFSTCWCDKSICFVTLSGVLWLSIMYLSALCKAADAAVATFFIRWEKKKKGDSCIFNTYKCQETEKASMNFFHWSMCCCLRCWLQYFCWYVCNCKIKETAEYTKDIKWKTNGKASPVGPLNLLKRNFNGSKSALFWTLSLWMIYSQ